MKLHFDFSQQATRAAILEQARACLDEDARGAVDRQVAALRVPDKHHGNLAAIMATIEGLDVSEQVREDMVAIYRILTEAEATVHETTVEEAHFHEVGRASGVRNVAEICLTVRTLECEKITATPVQAGKGTIQCAHGAMPIPAPATAVILDRGVPTCVERLEGERCTPTSAAIISYYVDEFAGLGAQVTYFQGPVPENPHGHGHDHGHHGHEHSHEGDHGYEHAHEHGRHHHDDDNDHEHAHSHHHVGDHDSGRDHDRAHEHGRNHDHKHGHGHNHSNPGDQGQSSPRGGDQTPFTASSEQHEKLAKLKEILAGFGCVAVAFSGGVDSTFLLDVATEVLGERAIAVTAVNELYPQRETDLAKGFCAKRSVDQTILEGDPLSIEGFAENPRNRCYLCKRSLFEHLVPLAQERAESLGLLTSGDTVAIVEGSNVSDRGDYRPGSQAVAEAGIRSPLDEAGLTKQDIRDLSRERSLETWKKPSFACLASRFPYGYTITSELLSAVDKAEGFMIDEGFPQVRVRVHDAGTVARIEVEPSEVERALHVLCYHGVGDKIRGLGFKHASLDVDGYRSGSMN